VKEKVGATIFFAFSFDTARERERKVFHLDGGLFSLQRENFFFSDKNWLTSFRLQIKKLQIYAFR
jgi:hypothetical protein